MKPLVIRTVQAAVFVTVVAGAVLAITPPHAEQIARAWLLALALIGSLAVAGLVASAPADTQRPPALWRRRRSAAAGIPADLESLQLAVELSVSSEFDRHYRLRPIMIEIASGVLARRHDVSLEHDQERASALLGLQLWELVRPDRPEPPGRGRRELDQTELVRMVESLEALG